MINGTLRMVTKILLRDYDRDLKKNHSGSDSCMVKNGTDSENAVLN